MAACMAAVALAWPSRFADAQTREAPPALEDMGNPARPQTGEFAGAPISIDFDDVSLLDVIAAIGLQTGRNFEVDPAVGNQKVTILSSHPIPADLALDLLESILATKNFVIVETLDGNLLKVVPRNAAQNNEKLTIYRGEVPPLDGFDNYSIHVVNVQYTDAGEVAEVLKNVGSVGANIIVYQQTNTLIISDTSDGLRNMFTLLEVLDVPGYNTTVEIFTLEYTRAEALAQQVQEVLMGDGDGSGQGRPAVPQRPTAVRQARATALPGRATTTVVGQQEEVLRMVPDERLNALIVVATESLMVQVRFLIEELDTPTPYDANNMHYVELQNADAESVAAALDSITSSAPRQAAQSGGAPAGEVQPFEKKVSVTSYEETNALIILASPQDFQLLKQMIDRLDVPRRQVNIEAIIMQVTISDALTLTVEAALLDKEHLFGVSNVVNLANVITQGPLALTGAGGTLGIIDGTVDLTDPLTGNTITVNNIPFLFRALESMTDMEVLSQPNLLTVDNSEARITVGQEIPIITGQSDINPQSGFQSRNNIQRRDVGVMLQVTPQISEGDYVTIQVEVEVSAATPSLVGIDPNETGATINQSLLTSEVVIRDGQTGIIGGLIQEGRDREVSQVPLLGDLPLIGFLFRSKGTRRNKQNLVVLLTPHIVKRGQDLKRVTDFRMREFYQEKLDIIFSEDGYIKTIKNKHRQRNKHKPTDRYNPNKATSSNFNRGNIER